MLLKILNIEWKRTFKNLGGEEGGNIIGRTRMDSPSRKANETKRMVLKFVDPLVIYRNFLLMSRSCWHCARIKSLHFHRHFLRIHGAVREKVHGVTRDLRARLGTCGCLIVFIRSEARNDILTSISSIERLKSKRKKNRNKMIVINF